MFENCSSASSGIGAFRIFRVLAFIAALIALWGGFASVATADAEAARKLATERGVIFARELADVPGKNLVVVKIDLPPASARPAPSGRSVAHRHPGSVYVYVVKGSVRFAVEGQPVQVVAAGGSAFESPGAVHTILENTSTQESAAVIAVLLVPDGASIATPVEESKK
jgi:quercetin dioxygenase-like cupin family protein